MARPGERTPLRVEGTDAGAALARGPLELEREHEGRWSAVSAHVRVTTLEGIPATEAVYFDVPPVPPGDYRVRRDLVVTPRADRSSLHLENTATLYAPLRVLPSRG